ncbi:MAG: FG-GAP-like repeat-containing protein [Planctomycetota bacterium]
MILRIANPAGGFAPHAANAGDIDRDGFDDFVIGASPAMGGGEIGARVYSARTGALLLGLSTLDFSEDPTEVAAAGDANGDGWMDLLLANPGHVARATEGRVWLFSGRDGTILHRWDGDKPEDGFGEFQCGVGDLDGDGAAEILIGASQSRWDRRSDTMRTSGPGYARVYSGRTWLPLFTVTGIEPGDALGGSACTLGDIDGDGRPDLAIGSFWTSKKAGVQIVSGADGRLIRQLEVPQPGDGGEVTVARLSDRNHDGIDDCGLSYRDRAIVVSPKDGRVLYSWQGPTNRVQWIDDFDRDGLPDFLTRDSTTRPTLIDEDVGIEARLYSGRTGAPIAETFFAAGIIPPPILSIGDVDGDRVQDFLMADGDVYVLSGAHFFQRTR